MAQITKVRTLDDLAKAAGRAVEAERPDVHFEIGGKAYEIDLAEENYQRLREVFAPYIQAARRATSPRLVGRSRTSTRRPATQQTSNSTADHSVAARLAGYVEQAPAPKEAPPATFIPAAKPEPAPARKRAPQPPRFPTKAEMNKAIRTWAAGKGVSLAARGAVPRDVVDQYVREHGQPVVG